MIELFMFIVVVGLFGYAMLSMWFQNRITVKAGRKERVVMQDDLGNWRVLGPGVHTLSPVWSKLEEVDVNRRPIRVSREEIKAGTVVLLADYVLEMAVGREIEPSTGKIIDISNIVDERVYAAATVIDIENHEQHVKQRVEGVLEALLGDYTDDQLTRPNNANPSPEVPSASFLAAYNGIRDHLLGGPNANPQTCRTTSELYRALSYAIEKAVNYNLSGSGDPTRDTGLNINAFQITNIVYRDDQVQKASELEVRLEKLRRGHPGLSDAQLLALDQDSFGQVSLGEGIGNAGNAIADGLRNFGRGNNNQNP